MEQKKFTSNIQEYAYLFQWLSHKFPEDAESEAKRKRLHVLAKANYSTKELAPFNKELGRARAGVLQHIVREIFSIPQRIAIDREIYRRLEGGRTPNFKYHLMPGLSDEVIQAAATLARKTVTELALGKDINIEQSSTDLRSSILALIRSTPPVSMIKDIIDGGANGTVSIEHITKTAYKYYPDFPFNN